MRSYVTPAITSAVLLASLSLSGCFSDSKKSQDIDVDHALKNSSQLEAYLKKGLIADASGVYVGAEKAEVAQDTAANGASQPGFGDSNNSSTTNTQEANVDEADLVKQNGDYLYAYSPRSYRVPGKKEGIKVYRTETNPVRSSLVGQYELPQQYHAFNGMYLHNDGLVTLSQSGSYSIFHDTPVGAVDDIARTSQPYSRMDQVMAASLSFLSLENPAQPNKTYQLEFEGDMISSRRVGNYLYLVNRFQPLIVRTQEDRRDNQNWTQKVIDTPFQQLLPRYWVNGQLQGRLFENSGCYLPELNEQGGYHNIVALVKIDLTQPSQWQAKCSSGRVHDVYASEKALFLAAGYYNEQTRIDQFSMTDLTLQASGKIPGFLQWPMPSFRMSEKDGHLRVLVSNRSFNALPEPIDMPVILESDNSSASTSVSNSQDNAPADNDSSANAPAGAVTSFTATSAQATSDQTTIPSWQDAHHRLYVLKANAQKTFDQIAVIPNTEQATIIGKPGEQVKSVRFRGDRAYIVTFRQTDPLYVINLEDQSKPFVEGELEIEGFSQYLHPLSSSLLLGLGVDANNNGRTLGLNAT